MNLIHSLVLGLCAFIYVEQERASLHSTWLDCQDVLLNVCRIINTSKERAISVEDAIQSNKVGDIKIQISDADIVKHHSTLPRSMKRCIEFIAFCSAIVSMSLIMDKPGKFRQKIWERVLDEDPTAFVIPSLRCLVGCSAAFIFISTEWNLETQSRSRNW